MTTSSMKPESFGPFVLNLLSSSVAELQDHLIEATAYYALNVAQSKMDKRKAEAAILLICKTRPNDITMEDLQKILTAFGPAFWHNLKHIITWNGYFKDTLRDPDHWDEFRELFADDADAFAAFVAWAEPHLDTEDMARLPTTLEDSPKE
ncbi:MAG: hypothetical protein COY40_04570 [Alphaproteobacteria bacterium CG_4_10_14_0_8_um_filter_53_9]|nr:MAG: hypothetical protein COY40_04570 [Alphaproteobacteria bacterium CG_4_10_14_0_8_um_filter_53_9]